VQTGFSLDYGNSELLVNFKIAKDLKRVTLNLTGFDLLNQRNTLKRQLLSNGVVDKINNALGRQVLLGISFKFGKEN